MELAAVFVYPGVRGVVAVLDEDGAGVPVLFLARDEVAAFDQENPESGWREPPPAPVPMMATS
jgi:hypothetical protein